MTDAQAGTPTPLTHAAYDPLHPEKSESALYELARSLELTVAALRNELHIVNRKLEKYRLRTDESAEQASARCAELERHIEAAQRLIAQGVEIMSLEQLSNWDGVRYWQETNPAESA